MEYTKGERIKHPTKEDWGVGEVLEDSSREWLKAFFVGVGEKTLALKVVQPIKLSGAAAADPLLDNRKLGKSASGIPYQSLPKSIEFFRQRFPEGFYGQRFESEERDYKVKAHGLMKSLLSQDDFSALLRAEDHAEIVRRALKVVGATNLLFPNEKMALKDGLQNPSAQKAFAESLFRLLFAESGFEASFLAFCAVLEEIDAAKWTTATYFPFITHPARHMFVKPTITRHAAELCGFEIHYKPRLNWLTYKCVLDFSAHLFSGIAVLKPRDMIDVQSFMWCVAPGKY